MKIKPDAMQVVTFPRMRQGPGSRIFRELKKNLALFSMLLPGVLFLLIFAYLPMGGIIIAFKEFRISGPSFIQNLLSSPWVGFKNFRFLFLTPNAINMTKNTVLYNLVFMVLQTIFPIGFAIGLNELRNKHTAKVYQAIFFVTFFLSWVTVSYFVYSLLNPEPFAG